MFRALRLSLTFCGDRFTTPQTLTFAVCHCLIVGSEHIACSNATCYNKTRTLFSAKFAYCIILCLDFHDYPRNENCREKVKINKNFNVADDQRLAVGKAWPISRSKLMSHTYKQIAGIICHFASTLSAVHTFICFSVEFGEQQ